jgi:pimeloyl-ACP methyl ester carboxylesterase
MAKSSMTLSALSNMMQWLGRRADARMQSEYEGVIDIPVKDPDRRRVGCGDVALDLLNWKSDGAPLVLLHGLNGLAWSWARVASLLCDEFNIYAPSQRGHGLSDAPESGYNLEQTSRDLLQLLDQEGLSSVCLAGESWGGKVALHFAATYPERVRSLALVDAVPPWGFNPLLRVAPFLVDAAMQIERRRYADCNALNAQAARTIYLPLGDEVDQRSWFERFSEQTDGSFVPVLPDAAYREILSKALAVDLSPLVKNLCVPVSLILPKMSIGFWPGEREHWLQLIPSLKIIRISGDHTVACTNPRALAHSLIGCFLSEHADG